MTNKNISTRVCIRPFSYSGKNQNRTIFATFCQIFSLRADFTCGGEEALTPLDRNVVYKMYKNNARSSLFFCRIAKRSTKANC